MATVTRIACIGGAARTACCYSLHHQSPELPNEQLQAGVTDCRRTMLGVPASCMRHVVSNAHDREQAGRLHKRYGR